MAELLFWLLLAATAYAYVGYPVLLWLIVLLARFRPRTAPAIADAAAHLPRVLIVVPSSDEPAVLARRLSNLRSLHYPPDLIEIVVGLDGAADDAAAAAEAARDPRVRLVRTTERVGKTALLNRLVAPSAADVVVFTDANSTFDEDAVRYLAASFADPRVGCVTGELVYVNRDDTPVRAGEGLYWRLENWIKDMESRFGGTLVSTGAVYAMRRPLCRPLPPWVSDDSTNPLLALAAGYRVIVEKRARAFERAPDRLAEEFGRKARMVTRQLGAHAQVGFFLHPFHPVLAFRLASHKWLRWLVPFFLIAAAALNVALLDGFIYRLTLAAACAGGVAAAIGAAALRWSLPVPAPLRLWVYFWMVNAAAFVGVIDFVTGRQRVVWPVAASTR